MLTSAAPAHDCPVSWHHRRESSGVWAETESTCGCSGLSGFALCLQGHSTRLGTLLQGISSHPSQLQPAAIPAGLSLTMLRTSSLSFPHPLLPFRSRSCLWWTPQGGSLFLALVCQICLGPLGFLIDSSCFCVFISAAALPQVLPLEQPSDAPA